MSALHSIVITLGLVAFGSTATAAQPEWWRGIKSSAHPPTRINPSMALATGAGEVVLFGGLDSGGEPTSETWTFAGVEWQLRVPTSSPPARFCHAMAYDALRQVVVLFGGWNNGYFADTWEWDGVRWAERT